MPNTQIVCAYSVTAVGAQSPAQLQALLAAVPLDYALPRKLGLIPTADTTSTAVNVVTRSITLKMGSIFTFSGAGNIAVDTGTPASPIRSVTLPGGLLTNYAAPPIVSFADPAPGKGFGAIAQLSMGIGAAVVLAGGTGYTGATKLTVKGGNQGGLTTSGGSDLNAPLPPVYTPPVPAVLTPTIIGGQILGFAIVNPGTGFTTFPEIIATDTGGGTGAIILASLVPVSVRLFGGGSSYTAPVCTFTPLFQSSAPDTSNQAGTMVNWMTQSFANALESSMVAAAPVVS
jgi:hypothetical protein